MGKIAKILKIFSILLCDLWKCKKNINVQNRLKWLKTHRNYPRRSYKWVLDLLQSRNIPYNNPVKWPKSRVIPTGHKPLWGGTDFFRKFEITFLFLEISTSRKLLPLTFLKMYPKHRTWAQKTEKLNF